MGQNTETGRWFFSGGPTRQPSSHALPAGAFGFTARSGLAFAEVAKHSVRHLASAAEAFLSTTSFHKMPVAMVKEWRMNSISGTRPEIRIRPYVDTDWNRLCVVHDSARLDELKLTVGTDAFLALEQTYEDERLFAGQLIVAELENNLVVGFAAWLPDELTWLYVEPSHYRKGIGRRLLRHVFSYSAEKLTTEVLEGNVPALKLYLSQGFEVTRRIEGKLEGNEAFAATGLVLTRSR